MNVGFQASDLKFKKFLHLSLALTFLLISACGQKNRPDKENQLGQAAPSFTLKDLNGTPFSLGNFKGKVVLLRFWSTRCESCKVEMPKLETSYRTLLPSGLMVIAVNVEDPRERAVEFVKELGLTYPILMDEKKEVTKLYQVYGVPTSFIIDRGGIVRERIFGDLTEEAIEKMVRPLL